MSFLNSSRMHAVSHSLEILAKDLQDARAREQITEKDFVARHHRLQAAFEQSERIVTYVKTSNYQGSKTSSYFDLPLLSDSTRGEQNIVRAFLRQTKLAVLQISATAKKASQWSYRASQGRTYFFLAVWQLSRLKIFLRRLEGQITQVRKARQILENLLESSQLKASATAAGFRNRDILTIFQTFENASGRVLAVQAKLRSETAKNHLMKSWLAHYAEVRRRKSHGKPLPDPLKMEEAFQPDFDSLKGPSDRAFQRLVVANQLAQSLGQSSGDQTPTLQNRNFQKYKSGAPKNSRSKQTTHPHRKSGGGR